MRLPGFCSTCRRPRVVRVSGHALATMMARGSRAPEGICAECEDREDAKRKERNTR